MKSFVSGHEDLVLDIAYDFYGRRLATASVDKHIKVFDKSEDGSWELCDSWKAHDGVIVKVSWAGPEYGQFIASCSHDSTVRIFEEDPREPLLSGRRWKRKVTLTDFNGPLYDIEFAPSHLGLKLASIGADGILRIHEALDPNTMGYWSLSSEVSLLTNPVARQLQSSFALAWCPSVFFTEYLVVCALEDAVIFKKDRLGKFLEVASVPGHKGLIRDVAWAPSMGRGFQLIATACKDGKVRIFRIEEVSSNSSAANVGSGANGTNSNGINSNTSGNSNNGTNSNGNSHNSNDMGFNVESTEFSSGNSGSGSNSNDRDTDSASKSLDVTLLHEFDDHQGEVWRVSWNLTGTILSSAGDDGKIRFWKAAYGDKFQCMAVVSAEQRAQSDENAIVDY